MITNKTKGNEFEKQNAILKAKQWRYAVSIHCQYLFT